MICLHDPKRLKKTRKAACIAMAYYKTFSQRLDQLLKDHRLTASALGARIGARTDLRRALAGELSEAKRSDLYARLCESGLFSGEECEDLRLSLEVSRVGLSEYTSRRSIDLLLSEPQAAEHEVCLLSGGPPLQRRLEPLLSADEISILCFNTIYPSLISALQPFFADPDRRLHMRHYLQPDVHGLNAAEFIACVSPVLFDRRYSPYLFPSWTLTGQQPALNGSMLILSARFGHHVQEQFYIISSATTAYELPNASAAGIYPFFCRIIDDLSSKPIPLMAFEQTRSDYASFIMSCLSRELNRATFSYGSDLSLLQVPTAIAAEALRDSVFLAPGTAEQLIRRVGPLHEQRFQNFYTKKKPTVITLSLEGCRHFLETGKSRDHFIGLRPFLPSERLRIFSTMLSFAGQNAAFSPMLLKADYRSRYLSVAFDRLGVAISEYDTDYNLNAGYDYVLITYPDFTRQYTSFFHETVLKERCHSRQESLRLLHELYAGYERKFSGSL